MRPGSPGDTHFELGDRRVNTWRALGTSLRPDPTRDGGPTNCSAIPDARRDRLHEGRETGRHFPCSESPAKSTIKSRWTTTAGSMMARVRRRRIALNEFQFASLNERAGGPSRTIKEDSVQKCGRVRAARGGVEGGRVTSSRLPRQAP